ncbi:MAG: pyrroloquinoline quinone biosynthesis protein PqqB [Rhodothermia bacterium]|nr:MAG: pyrroloquinoline quinone biosynthesis protein PqqB [Rhodothermia bacterium]
MRALLTFSMVALSLQLSPFIAMAQIGGPSQGPFILVLGIAQDAGVPQSGDHTHPGWTDPEYAHLATSLGLVDPNSGKKWMFDASPDFRQQWYLLERTEPSSNQLTPDGIFLTHAHIGHYTGLMFLGHESIGASSVSVYAMPLMAEFLELNGPWEQLVRYQNIRLRRMGENIPVRLTNEIQVIPFLVPHRQEYSEVVGYRIEGPNRTALFIPDIDSWEEWDDQGRRLEGVLQSVDLAFIDGSFFANGEIPGRDMSGFPHPFISQTMNRLKNLPDTQRAKIRFIHLNHTNPALNLESEAAKSVIDAGFGLARRLERYDL